MKKKFYILTVIVASIVFVSFQNCSKNSNQTHNPDEISNSPAGPRSPAALALSLPGADGTINPYGTVGPLGCRLDINPQHPIAQGRIGQFHLEIAPETRGLIIARQPQIDRITKCNGADQYSPYQPWTNTTKRDLFIRGALISAGSDAELSVIGACLKILDVDGSVRRTVCSSAGADVIAPINVEGAVEFPSPEVVYPGEQFVYQARNHCQPGGLWGATAYLHLSY